jgi:hypothetical protein
MRQKLPLIHLNVVTLNSTKNLMLTILVASKTKHVTTPTTIKKEKEKEKERLVSTNESLPPDNGWHLCL